MSGLAALSPGMMSTPLAPPLSASARLSRRKRLLGFSGPWHWKHVFSKIGWMSAENVTGRDAAGGSLLGSRSAAPAPAGARQAAARAAAPAVCAREGTASRRMGSIEELGIEIRSVHAGVASGRPAGAHPQKGGVIELADHDLAGCH